MLEGTLVLVVDGDRESARMTRALLADAGARVRVASDGGDALRQLNGDLPALILCDALMPLTDGLELARHVREQPRLSHLRLVALTAANDESAYFKTWSAGFDGHLEKPLTAEKVERLAEHFLSGSRPERRGRRRGRSRHRAA